MYFKPCTFLTLDVWARRRRRASEKLAFVLDVMKAQELRLQNHAILSAVPHLQNETNTSGWQCSWADFPTCFLWARKYNKQALQTEKLESRLENRSVI